VKPDSRYALGIDIGGTNTKIAFVSGEGEVVSSHSIPTDLSGGVDAFLDRVAGGVEEASVVGVSVAGFVNDERTRMIYNPNLPELENYPLKEGLEARFGRSVTLDADSNSACFGEHRVGMGVGSRRFLCLVLGTGAGGGMIIDGQIVRLAHGGLGDLGHVIVKPGGPACSGGCRGCLEAMVQANAEPLGHYVGIALASYAAVLFPDRIAIGGGRAEAGEGLLKPAEKAFRATAGAFFQQGVTIHKARLGWQASVVGAALEAYSTL
jgi:glucokinase